MGCAGEMDPPLCTMQSSLSGWLHWAKRLRVGVPAQDVFSASARNSIRWKFWTEPKRSCRFLVLSIRGLSRSCVLLLCSCRSCLAPMIIAPSDHELVGFQNAMKYAAVAYHDDDDNSSLFLSSESQAFLGLAGHQRLWQVPASQVTRLGKRHATAEPASAEAGRNDGQTSESQSMTVCPAQPPTIRLCSALVVQLASIWGLIQTSW